MDNKHFYEMSGEEQAKAMIWITQNISPRTTANYNWSSYAMKHVLERRTNIYMSNNQFKEAMMACGFDPVDPHALNWHFAVSQKSPIFKLQNDGCYGLPTSICVMQYGG